MDLTNTQKTAFNLASEDLRFIYTIMLANKNEYTPYFAIALQPYIGLITDGIEQWAGKIQLINKYIPKFTEEEKAYYTEMRNNIKIWSYDYHTLNKKFYSVYNEEDIFFSDLCKPIARKLRLYDIYGCFIVNEIYCDNTILDCIFTPYYNHKEMYGEYKKSMYVILGKLIKTFGADKLPPLTVNNKMKFNTQDFCGFEKSPTGYKNYNNTFILFSVLCMINFLIVCIDEYVLDESPTKLRFIYLQYFYLVQMTKEINTNFNSNFAINDKWYCKEFRNCLAHYGIGNVLKQNEVIEDDIFGGLTYKFFNCDWIILKSNIISELKDLSKQIQNYLHIS